ncbi:MAG: VWA domain-containing protein [Acidobacteriota bacterium]
MTIATLLNPSFSRRRPAALTLGVLAASLALSAAAGQQPTFRSSVDLVAVDVQVVDADGNPVAQIDPADFHVTISGKRRRVVSAQFVRDAAGTPSPLALASKESPLPEVRGSGRTMILAVDTGSFEPGTERPPMEALRNVVATFDPADKVGLYTYPRSTWMAPSIDRAPLRVRLDGIAGDRQPLRSHYNLRPWEIVDITAQSTNPNSFLTASRNQGRGLDPTVSESFDPVLKIQRRECPGEADCPIRIYEEGVALATQLERESQASVAGLEALLEGVARIPGRKFVVLVSAGLLVSDRLDGRPDVGDMARVMGQAAARANATVYTIHVDTHFSGGANAERKGAGSTDTNRERAIFGNWLDKFSDGAGGTRIHVPVGDGSFALARVLRESSAYYLLGVEPEAADRDGRARTLSVKVDRKNVSIRSRQWVVIPPAAPKR